MIITGRLLWNYDHSVKVVNSSKRILTYQCWRMHKSDVTLHDNRYSRSCIHTNCHYTFLL